MRWVWVAAVCLCALAAACSSSAKSSNAPTAAVSPTTVLGATPARTAFDAYLAAFNKGNVDAALALLTPNAVLTSPQCGATPCTGTAAIRTQIAKAAAAHTQLTVSDINQRGSAVRGNFTITADDMPPGVTRGTGAFAAAVSNGKISYLTIDYDRSDPQTAKLLG